MLGRPGPPRQSGLSQILDFKVTLPENFDSNALKVFLTCLHSFPLFCSSELLCTCTYRAGLHGALAHAPPGKPH